MLNTMQTLIYFMRYKKHHYHFRPCLQKDPPDLQIADEHILKFFQHPSNTNVCIHVRKYHIIQAILFCNE